MGSTDYHAYEVYALKYAHHERNARQNFIHADIHDGSMPMDYFVWIVRNADRVVVVDTGFGREVAQKRKREFLRCPVDSLKLLGIDAADVRDVVITHMHYDHVGNFSLFPNARFHVQDKEVGFATGRNMRHVCFRGAYEADDVVALVRKVYEDRVVFHDGDDDLFPGISLHLIGGHTAGLQAVRVWTRKGWLVLASDASHYYANMEQGNPFPIVYNVGDMLEGQQRLYRLADARELVIPGHDPAVLDRFPAPETALKGIVARLD